MICDAVKDTKQKNWACPGMHFIAPKTYQKHEENVLVVYAEISSTKNGWEDFWSQKRSNLENLQIFIETIEKVT